MTTKTYSVRFELSGWGQLQRNLRSLQQNLDAVGENLRGVGDESERAAIRAGRAYNHMARQVQEQFDAMGIALRRRYRELVPRQTRLKDAGIPPSTLTQYNQPGRQAAPVPSSVSTVVHVDSKLDTGDFMRQYRQANSELVSGFREALEEFKQEGKGVNPFSIIAAPFELAASAITTPISTIIFGGLEEIGASLTADFSRGLAQATQKSLGLPFDELGTDLGELFGEGILKTFTELSYAMRRTVMKEGSLTDNLVRSIDFLFREMIKDIGVRIPVIAARAYRRVQVSKVALDKVAVEAAANKINNPIPDWQQEEINKAKSITIAVGGFNQDPDDFGKDYTAALFKPLLKGSAVIPVARKNLGEIDAEFKELLSSLLRSALDTEIFRNSIVSFVRGTLETVPEEQRNLYFKDLDLESNEGIVRAIQGMIDSDIATIIKAVETMFRGFSLDDIVVAAKALQIIQANPDKPLQIVGFSQGGNEAAGATELLYRLGYKGVKGIGIGTPVPSLNYTGPKENFLTLLGTEDYYYQIMGKALQAIGSDIKTAEGEGKGHLMQLYMTGEKAKSQIQAFLGDRVDIPSIQEYSSRDAAALMAATKGGAPLSVMRTVLNTVGVGDFPGVSKDRYYFSREDLAGYTEDIRKNLRRITNPEIKDYLTKLVAFLDEMQKELFDFELAQLLGVDYKAVDLLQKAKEFYPELRALNIAPSKGAAAQESLKKTKEEMPTLTEFSGKAARERANIERTITAMLGGQIPKGAYAFFHPEEYRVRAGEHLQGLINYWRSEFFDKAMPKERDLIEPYLEFLERLQKEIIAAGETGTFDKSVLAEGQSLFGIKLKDEIASQLPKLKSDPRKQTPKSEQERLLKRLSQEFPVIERTFRAMLGDALPEGAYSFFDAQEYRVRAEEHLQGLINQLKSAYFDKATDADKAVMQPYFDFLSNLQKQIIAKGETGTFNPKVIEQAQSILGMHLPEEITSRMTPIEPETPQKVIEKYTNFLNKIIQTANQEAEQKIKGLIPNAQRFTIQELREMLKKAGVPAELKSRMREWRKAVSEGRVEVARRLGEGLLADLEIARKILQETAQQTGADNPLTSSGSARSIQGTLTRMQNEIISGMRWRGSSPIGLTQLLEQSPEELQKLAEELGTAVNIGMAEGIRGSAQPEQATQELAQDVIDTAKENFEIRSPSRVFEEIGVSITEGMQRGIESGERQVLPAVDELLQKTIDKSLSLFESIEKRIPGLGRLKQIALELGGSILSLFGFFTIGDAILRVGTDSLQAAREMESLEVVIRNISGSSARAADNLAFVRAESKRLGLDIKTATSAYAQFVGAIRGTPLEGKAGEEIFSAFGQAALQYQLTAETQQRIFLAVNQMISKGKIQAEELRQQLGEVLPGALDTLATSLGLTIEQLNKMMERGELITSEVLPRFAAQLSAQSAEAVATAQGTITASLTRFNNALFEFKASVGAAFAPIQKAFLDMSESTLTLLTRFGDLIATLVGSALLSWLIQVIQYFGNSAAVIQLVKMALYAFLDVIIKSIPALMAFAAKFAMITAAVESIKLLYNTIRNPFTDIEKGAELASVRVAKLRDALSDLNRNQRNQAGGDVGAESFMELANADFLDPVRRLFSGTRVKRDGRRGRVVIEVDTTLAGKQMREFEIATRSRLSRIDENLMERRQIEGLLIDIETLDRRIAELKTRELNTPLQNAEALKTLRDEQANLMRERQQMLSATSLYAQNLITDLEYLQNLQDDLDQKLADRRITRPVYEQLSRELGARLKGVQEAQQVYQDLSSRISKELDVIGRSLKSLNSVLDAIRENATLRSGGQRIRAIQKAFRDEFGTEALSQAISQITQAERAEIIQGIRDSLANVDQQLNSDFIKGALANLQKTLDEAGIRLDSIAAIQEQINAEGISQQEKSALGLLLRRRELQNELLQIEEQFAQEALDMRNRARDLARQSLDFIERLQQQILDVQQQILQAQIQLSFGEQKNRLQALINPSYQTFVGNLVGGIQSLLDAASQLQERILGQRGEQIRVGFEQNSLARELEDFRRQVDGATIALDQFRRGLLGGADPEGRIQSGAGQVVFPILGRDLSNTPITSGFGPRIRPTPGASSFHRGVDFGVPAGTPVVAPRASTVESISPMPGGEYAVYLSSIDEQGRRIREGLLHINQIMVKVGDAVSPGQLIGRVSGVISSQSSGAHLDYRVAVNGQYVDPKQFLAGMTAITNPVPQSVPANLQDRTQQALQFYLSKGLSKQGAAYLVGNLIQESGLDPNAVGDRGTARGLAQWRGDRQRGMPADFVGQLGFVLEEMQRDPQSRAAGVLGVLQDPNASVERIKQALRIFERYAIEGDRYAYGASILQQMQSQMPGSQAISGSDVVAEAATLTDTLIQKKYEQLAVQRQITEQEKESLSIQIQQYRDALPEQIRQQYQDASLAVEELGIRLQDLAMQQQQGLIDPQTGIRKAILDTRRQFESYGRELDNRIRQTQAEIQGLRQLSETLPTTITQLQSQGQGELAEALQMTLDRASAEIPRYERLLADLQALAQQVQPSQKQAEEWARVNAEFEARKRQLEQSLTLSGLQMPVQASLPHQLRAQVFEFEATALQKQIETRKILNDTARQQLEIEQQIALIKSQLAYAVDPQQLQFLEAELANRQEMLATLQQMQQINLANLNTQFKDFGQHMTDLTRNQFADFMTSIVMGTKTIGEAFRDMAMSIIAEIARISAQKLAAQLFGGGGGGGGVFDFLGGLFGFAEGGTVPALFAGGNPDNVKRYPLDEALRREGTRGVLAVFTPGEEVLSLKTGEAQRYQALKRKWGRDPLRKLQPQLLRDGGTIEARILGALPRQTWSYDLASPELAGVSFARSTSAGSGARPQIINVNMAINTPDANSFRRSQSQIEREMGVSIRKSVQRND